MAKARPIKECTVTGQHSDFMNAKEWLPYRADLLDTPAGAIKIGNAKPPFSIEIEVTEDNHIKLFFKSAGTLICSGKISNADEKFPGFYNVATVYRAKVRALPSAGDPTWADYHAARTELHEKGTKILVGWLKARLNVDFDPRYARNLFFLCAHALRDGPG